MHPNGKFVYGSNRGHDSIAVFAVDASTGKLALIQSEPAQGKLPRHFAIDPSGKWLWAESQNSDSIAIFAVGTDGDLTYVGEEWTRGDYPRSFGFDPTGRFLYCCNQRADHVTVFKVDRETGRAAEPILVDRLSGKPITPEHFTYAAGPAAGPEVLERVAFMAARAAG